MNSKFKLLLLFFSLSLILPNFWALENGLIINDAYISSNNNLTIDYEDYSLGIKNTDLVVFYVINNTGTSSVILKSEATKFMYDLTLIKPVANNRSQFLADFKLDKRFSDSYGLRIVKATDDRSLTIDLNCFECEKNAIGFNSLNQIGSETKNISIFLARYDVGRNLFIRDFKSSVIDKENISKDSKKYTSTIFGKYLKQEYMFEEENLESCKYSFDYIFDAENTEKGLAAFPEDKTGTEGELEQLPQVILTNTTEQEETSNQEPVEFINASLINQNLPFEAANYKLFNFKYYTLFNLPNSKKRIYSFNQAQTFVIKNSAEEATIDKIVEIGLNLDKNTSVVYIIIDAPQSKTIPSKNQFVAINSPSIDIKKNQTRHIKISKSNLKDKITLNYKADVENVSLQMVELDSKDAVLGTYSTNVLQLTESNFNKYTLFQINKNLIKFYCPNCKINDYGINYSGFSNCGKLEEALKTSEQEILKEKQNVCLIPGGSKIGGFTSESFEVFGFDKLFFEWNNDSITSDTFDYGEYYVDQDQFRIAISKKLDAIRNNEYLELSGIKYKKGKNNLISKVSRYQEYDLNQITAISPNSSIDASLEYSIKVLGTIPVEYKKLTIIDIVNNEPIVSDLDFEKIMHAILNNSSEYYKAKDYHTHYQINLSKYLSSIENFKNQNSTGYSDLLYSLYYKTIGYSNIYYSEGLNYFIYNIKPFGDLSKETKNILNNEYTRFLSNYWSLELINTKNMPEPSTVIIEIKEILDDKKAKLEIKETSKYLGLNYYFNNKYYAYNPLFFNSINAFSYKYTTDVFGQSNSVIVKEIKTQQDFSDLQYGSLVNLNFNNSQYQTNMTKPIIIRKSISDNIVIKYFDGKEYKIYNSEFITTIDSFEDFPTTEAVVIYPQKQEKPLLVESSERLIFNIENVEYTMLGDKFVYSLPSTNYIVSFKELINGISNGYNCFSVINNELSIWDNIDEQLRYAKSKSYSELFYAFEEEPSSSILTSSDNSVANTAFAIYTIDETSDSLKTAKAVNSFIKDETETRNKEILKNYNLAYQELLKSDNTLNKSFINLLPCSETLICQVSKTKYVPEDQFYERFKALCIPNTPTECVKNYWPNPKTNYCSAFIRNFTKNQFGYNFDSADAWDLAKQPNNKSIWKATTGFLSESDYDYLIPGSVLGIKHNNTSYTDKFYSHVVVYLGKIGSKHYIIHSWNNTLKIEKLDVFLKTTARGQNVYGDYEDGKIKEVLISNNLYLQLAKKAKEKTIFLGSIDYKSSEMAIPDYLFDNYNNFELVATSQKDKLNDLMYAELEEVYNRILEKDFDIYYKKDYSTDSAPELTEKIKLPAEEPMIIVLGKYKKIFVVIKENNKTNVVAEYSISSGVDGFGCELTGLKTPIGLFRVVQKVGKDCLPFQVIVWGSCDYKNGKPVIAPINSGVSKITTRKLIIDGLEKSNLGINCENGNRNTIYRGVYIHGTNYENSMGQQRSHGCIRLLNNDVISLFNLVKDGTYVYVYNSDTSYSQLLDLEDKLASSDESLSSKIVKSGESIISKKTEKDIDNYTNSRINSLSMISKNMAVSLDYLSCINQKNLKFICYIQQALNTEYNQHILTEQSTEFNYIVIKVAKTFNFTLEETALFWGSLAQESGTSTNINGAESKYGSSLAGKPAYGIAQIEYAPWSQYTKNKETFKQMVPYFNSVDLSPIIQKDSKIGSVTKITGNKNTIDSVEEIEALLDLIWKNNSKYASVVFSAGLKKYIGYKLITNTDKEPRPFYHRMYLTYDDSDSLNFNFAVLYKYKYTSTSLMYDGIREYKYSEFKDAEATLKTLTLKLANYLAFKKEYYMYHYGLIDATHSDLLATMKNAKII